MDLSSVNNGVIEFSRVLSSHGFYRPLGSLDLLSHGFGDFWRHSYSSRIFAEKGTHLLASVARHDGTTVHFRPDGKPVHNVGRSGDSLERIFNTQGLAGWLYRSSSGSHELYDASGKLQSVVRRDGRRVLMTYSDAVTPTSIAPKEGLLIAVTDDFGRSLKFTYHNDGWMKTLTSPNGQIFDYIFDGFGALQSMQFPDGLGQI